MEASEKKELEKVIKEIKEADTLAKKAVVVQKLIKEVKNKKLKEELIKVFKIIQDIIMGRDVSLERMLEIPFRIPILPPPRRALAGEMEEAEEERKGAKPEETKTPTYKPISMYAPKTTYMGRPEEGTETSTGTYKQQTGKTEAPHFGGLEKPTGLVEDKPLSTGYKEKEPRIEDYKNKEEYKPIGEKTFEKKKEKKW